MSEDTSKRSRFRFELRTLLFWVIPYTAMCLFVLTSCREPATGPGEGIPVLHWSRLVAVGVMTAVWIVLFWEDSRARQRQRDENSTAANPQPD
jgi:hypothetical protein